MILTELLDVKDVLEKIKNKDSRVDRAIAFVDKELALRKAQSKARHEDRQDEYDLLNR